METKLSSYSNIIRARADSIYTQWEEAHRTNKLVKAEELWKKYIYHVSMFQKLRVEENKFRKSPRKPQPKADEETDSTVTNPIARKYLKETNEAK